MNFTFNPENISIDSGITMYNDFDIVSQYCTDLPIFILNQLMKFFIVFMIIDFFMVKTKYYQRAINVYYKMLWFMWIYVIYYWISFKYPNIMDIIADYHLWIIGFFIGLTVWGLYKEREIIKKLIGKIGILFK